MSKKEKEAFLETPASAQHKKERFWQIIFPIAVICVVVLAVLIFLISRDGKFYPGISELGASAAILVILPILPILLVNLAIICALIYGMVKLRGVVRPLGSRVLKTLESARWKISNISDASIQPLLAINENGEKAKQAFRSLNKRLKDKRNEYE